MPSLGYSRVSLALTFTVLAICAHAQAPSAVPAPTSTTTVQVPRLIRINGTLNLPATPDESVDKAARATDVTFSLYAEETGGEPLWQETQHVESDATGRYNVLLGSTQPEGLPVELFTSAQARWLGVARQGEPEQPRIMLVSVPFALKAGDAETLGGKPPSAYAAAPPGGGIPTSGVNPASPGGTGSPGSNIKAHPLTIAGTGTADYVPLWTSSTGLSNSVIFQSGSSLGIGTKTPTAAVHVVSASPTAIIGASNVTSGNTTGVEGQVVSPNGSGVYGYAESATGTGSGVAGVSESPNGEGVFGGNGAVTGAAIGVRGTTKSPNGVGVGGGASATTGSAIGVSGITSSPEGAGVSGTASSATGTGYGVYGKVASPTGIGVFGLNASKTGGTGGSGVEGQIDGPLGAGVYGDASATTGATAGVLGMDNSVSGAGVNGTSVATTGAAAGVSGTANSSSGYGGIFLNNATTGSAKGLSSISNSPSGYGGLFTNNATTGNGYALGALSRSTAGIAVKAIAVATSTTGGQVSDRPVGVWGDTNQGGAGVVGTADNALAVLGVNNSTDLPAGSFENKAVTGTADGVNGFTASTGNNASGVFGNATAATGNTNGVYGTSASSGGTGVYGTVTATSGYGYGVWGGAAVGTGVYGDSKNGPGVTGHSSSSGSDAVYAVNEATGGDSNGIYAQTNSAGGVAGFFNNGSGGYILVGIANGAPTHMFDVDGSGNGSFAGSLNVGGSLTITGTLIKGGGSFKIDDPLDPANKTLSHSFVESPDMMNIYNGRVRLDAHGEAWVTMPHYFEALNRDFQYVLTAVRSSQPRLYVAEEIKGNRFKISGGRANGEVSWMVTGIRQDAWANANRIPTEEEKPPLQRGTYLHPDLYGANAAKSANAMLRH